MNKSMVLLLSIFLFSGCVTKYKFSEVESNFNVVESNIAKNRILSLQIFEDVRATEKGNKTHFTKKKTAKGKENILCLNAERRYEQPLAYRLTKIATFYLKKPRIFKDVVYEEKGMADYYVTAKLKNYRMIQKLSNLAVSASIVAPPIARKIMTFESEGELLIQLDEVRLYNKHDKLVKEIGLIETNKTGLFPADVECWCAYWAAEEHYPDVIEQLLNQLVEAVEDYESQ